MREQGGAVNSKYCEAGCGELTLDTRIFAFPPRVIVFLDFKDFKPNAILDSDSESELSSIMALAVPSFGFVRGVVNVVETGLEMTVPGTTASRTTCI